MRVGIIALLHESNTFIACPTTLPHFRENTLCLGEQVLSRFAGTHHELGGFLEGLCDERLEAVPVFAARAVPYGVIAADAFGTLLQLLFDQLDAAGQLDGLLVAPHGATVSEAYPDADGFWLTELRRRVGQETPIIGTLDAHANLSPAMVAATNALIAYRSNPHLDQRERGLEATRLMARTLRGEVRPTQAASFPPLAINIERQLTSEPHLRQLYEQADRMLLEQQVLSNSILLGFPYADVAEMGAAALVVTHDDRERAARLAERMGRLLWDHRQEFVGQMISVDEALRRAATLDGPICLLDMGDNVGGGSPGDSTHLAHAILSHGMREAFVCLFDPASVGKAVDVGIGNSFAGELGGKTDQLHGEPLADEFIVQGLYSGRFDEPQPRHGGFTACDQGPTAVVRNKRGLTVMLTTKRMPPFSLQQLLSCDLNPPSFHVVVAKGVNAPVAAYAPVCRHLIRTNTPGCTSADMTQLDFKLRRRPMFPFEVDADWHAEGTSVS